MQITEKPRRNTYRGFPSDVVRGLGQLDPSHKHYHPGGRQKSSKRVGPNHSLDVRLLALSGHAVR